ncbi:hypothetical protein ACF06N_23795 [Streptomyces albidoflavus]
MSNTTLRAALALHRAAQTWTTRVVDRAANSNRSDRGAGFVEYAGLMILIAGIFTLIDQLGLDGTISSAIGDAVKRVVGGG